MIEKPLQRFWSGFLFPWVDLPFTNLGQRAPRALRPLGSRSNNVLRLVLCKAYVVFILGRITNGNASYTVQSLTLGGFCAGSRRMCPFGWGGWAVELAL